MQLLVLPDPHERLTYQGADVGGDWQQLKSFTHCTLAIGDCHDLLPL